MSGFLGGLFQNAGSLFSGGALGVAKKVKKDGVSDALKTFTPAGMAFSAAKKGKLPEVGDGSLLKGLFR